MVSCGNSLPALVPQKSIPPRNFPLGPSIPAECSTIYIDKQELHIGTGPADKHRGQQVFVSGGCFFPHGEDDEGHLSTSDTLIAMCGEPLAVNTMNVGLINHEIYVAL